MAKTITPTLSATSVTMTAKQTYKLEYESNGQYSYTITNTAASDVNITVDLSDIPANSTITSAVLTWTPNVVNNNFSGTTGTGYGRVKCNSGSSIALNTETANVTANITPGATNTFTFSYRPTVKTSITTTSLKNSSGTSKLTCSDIELSITYEPGAALSYYTNATTKKSCTVHYYTGSAWKDCEVYYWNGSTWKQCGV